MTQKQPQHTRDPREETKSLEIEVASQWKLMWWKFRKHKLAMASAVIIIIAYAIAIFAEFVAPVASSTYSKDYVNAPPQWPHFFQPDKPILYVNALKFETDPNSFKKTWTIDEETEIPLGFFVKGDPYKLWGLIPSDIHLIGTQDPQAPFYMMGSDALGRDVFSRIVYGSRVSLTVCLVGTTLSLFLGMILGGLAGFMGGWVDNVIQRLSEILTTIPTLPLWLALAAVVPLDWSPLRVYFMITLILALIQWVWLARVVRGKLMALREEDFITAAILDGVGQGRLIGRHMIPSMLSHIIASFTLNIPGMILAETALSFLGVGLRPPVVSWGVMLQETQRVGAIANYPWMMFPGLAVFIMVVTLNFLGDGLRDAADPYQ
ncbi:MAG: ABC transporter permease [Anaerolineae bacterium]|nr:ABC transporter permease [Anaerolineae bacterium]